MNLTKKIAGVAFLLTFTGAAMAQNLAVVNGEAIPMSRFDRAVSLILPPNTKPTEEQKEQIKRQVINVVVLEQAAKAQKIDRDPRFQAGLNVARSNLLVQMLGQQYLQKNPVSQADLQAAYDAAAKSVPQEYEAQHILTKTKEEADAILKKLKAGEDFSSLAKSTSQDPGTAPNGGNLGWSPATNYVPVFAKALQSLKKGQMLGTPVQTQFGYHIIKVNDVRAPQVPPLAEVQEQLLTQLSQQKANAYFDSLLAKAKIQ